MFNRNKKLEEEIAKLNGVIAKNNEDHVRFIQKLQDQHEYEMSKMSNKFQDDLARSVSNQDTVLEQRTKTLNDSIVELSVKTQTQAKEIEMYTKAFENLGFDVKDMKDILNKLVDGLIAKNEIKLVK